MFCKICGKKLDNENQQLCNECEQKHNNYQVSDTMPNTDFKITTKVEEVNVNRKNNKNQTTNFNQFVPLAFYFLGFTIMFVGLMCFQIVLICIGCLICIFSSITGMIYYKNGIYFFLFIVSIVVLICFLIFIIMLAITCSNAIEYVIEGCGPCPD